MDSLLHTGIKLKRRVEPGFEVGSPVYQCSRGNCFSCSFAWSCQEAKIGGCDFCWYAIPLNPAYFHPSPNHRTYLANTHLSRTCEIYPAHSAHISHYVCYICAAASVAEGSKAAAPDVHTAIGADAQVDDNLVKFLEAHADMFTPARTKAILTKCQEGGMLLQDLLRRARKVSKAHTDDDAEQALTHWLETTVKMLAGEASALAEALLESKVCCLLPTPIYPVPLAYIPHASMLSTHTYPAPIASIPCASRPCILHLSRILTPIPRASHLCCPLTHIPRTSHLSRAPRVYPAHWRLCYQLTPIPRPSHLSRTLLHISRIVCFALLILCPSHPSPSGSRLSHLW